VLAPPQQLRKLQLAVDHIAAVIEDVAGDGALENLNDALDHIHHAESAISEEAER
jgi:hypothetical protein